MLRLVVLSSQGLRERGGFSSPPRYLKKGTDDGKEHGGGFE